MSKKKPVSRRDKAEFDHWTAYIAEVEARIKANKAENKRLASQLAELEAEQSALETK